MKKTLLEVNNPLDTNIGIFRVLFTNHPDISWLDESKVDSLDIDYYVNHSATKLISSLYERLIEHNEELALDKLAEMIYLKNIDNWNNIYQAYTLEYNPLENYNSNEIEKVKSKVKTSTSTSSDTYGFNSVSAVPSDKVTSEAITEGNKDDNVRELKRSGNIGVTTSQQMLKSELDLRIFKFYDRVMNDIDSMMCLKCY